MPFRPLPPPRPVGLPTDPPLRTRPLLPVQEPAAPTPATNTPHDKRAHHQVGRTGENWDADGNYVVGKGRPPKATQWKKGQSGNPRGPVKHLPLSAQEQFEKAFLAPFNATVNGKTVPLTMDVFAVQSLKSASAKGSVTAARILLDVYMSLIRQAAEQEPGPQVDAWEQEAIDRLLAELGLPQRPVVRQTDRSNGHS